MMEMGMGYDSWLEYSEYDGRWTTDFNEAWNHDQLGNPQEKNEGFVMRNHHSLVEMGA